MSEASVSSRSHARVMAAWGTYGVLPTSRRAAYDMMPGFWPSRATACRDLRGFCKGVDDVALELSESWPHRIALVEFKWKRPGSKRSGTVGAFVDLNRAHSDPMGILERHADAEAHLCQIDACADVAGDLVPKVAEESAAEIAELETELDAVKVAIKEAEGRAAKDAQRQIKKEVAARIKAAASRVAEAKEDHRGLVAAVRDAERKARDAHRDVLAAITGPIEAATGCTPSDVVIKEIYAPCDPAEAFVEPDPDPVEDDGEHCDGVLDFDPETYIDPREELEWSPDERQRHWMRWARDNGVIRPFVPFPASVG